MGKLGKLIERERERERERRETDRQTDRQTDRDRQRDRQTERDRQRQRETERDRERVTKLQMTKYYKLHCKFLGSILTDSFTEREQCKILFPTFSTVGAI